MEINFDKNKDGLVPVIIQNYLTEQVLMLGYMNAEAYQKTLQEGKVTFFSRSKNRLWTKGETSGNFLELKETLLDCDQDTLLIKVKPNGPTCHTGSVSCFGNQAKKGFLYELQQVISDRIDHNVETSYTNQLYKRGINKVAQKVGEEAVEVVIEAKDDNEELFKNESADLLYHFLILLKAKGFTLEEIETVLRERHS
ncbi:bifunctional phosphoribosyl-AMP cyclohydrolase/phosphoribosyl-ATP diphosphatase HisIE [Elizabethkingia meningoseptica]|uniref:bifunctional phosphoribosyl-AMP cyclohydrolase/phosphoribosyl-ATP diphosphatase HisIE n=1 Tax=Elizabethkingia meningoseptica TaxID=238 RepID=UPI0009994A60|nr:bifunctional phosphoribosyl-AMP cyclohydrolase/phosphoribosyl-ATP diphosphatase HisIE [Elizabethkingia meningoseptica]MDE5430023.1 bifunctional phosphoribosyl-AMP cyclohydrolase/phosphoribosyl-ATP diphosphatase HisIE [Elizabethkingia meningoseptica]MDE5487927.1 bifunctional phosphoribosyl-AMP cyclohydrolase/phosphoribosyl-ATP diphosphatase HisIE [Elizabethkingia meningoseptica]MDE5491594.1 bifunctional phosphoribosyl-AMP cyclohydrolase/phosphoribosyl-ATP diphosphatase HisIE [Elizabethkingia m